MLYAVNESGERVLATPKKQASCPSCGASMVAKCGRTVVWHWAHESIGDCDSWSEGETHWHAAWKSRWANNEVAIERSLSGVLQRHRADAMTPCGTVIEFQHSTISAEQIEERERFYGDMIWVIDATPAFRGSRVCLNRQNPQSGSPFCKFRWLHRKRSFDSATAPVFLDLGMAFDDIGDSFWKKSPWWDDGIDGLRDGVRRSEGVWTRSVAATYLLEIKKRTDGFGWGRLVTHRDFCLRFGAASPPSSEAVRCVRKLCEPYSGFDGYAFCGMQYPFIPAAVVSSSPYGWCKEERSKGAKA